jgi:hypothetical protein
MFDSGKKTSTNTNTTANYDNTSANTSTASTNVNVPDWLLHPAQTQASTIGGLMSQGSSSYTPQTSSLQQQAFDDAGNLQTTNLGYGQAKAALNGAPSVGGNTVQAGSVLDNLSSYYNPYESAVMDPTMAAFDQNADQTRASQAAQAANGAFNSTRYGVTQALTEGQLALARSQTQGGLLNDMYNTATGLSAGDKDRSLAGQTTNANLAQQAQIANQNAAIQKAQTLDTIANNKNATINVGNEATTQGNAARQEPLTFANQTGTLLSGLDPSSYFGKTIDSSGNVTSSGTDTSNSNSTTKETSQNIMGTLGQAAQIAALFI